MTEVDSTSVPSSRPTRERKPTQRLEPEKTTTAAKSFSYTPGNGTPLGEIPYFRHATDGLSSDEDVLILLHTLFFGSAGKNTMRKRQLRLFSGYPDSGPTESSLVNKITNSKKWTLSVLKTVLGLFGLEKGGTREEVIRRLVEFISSPREVRGVPVAKKSLKRKKTEKKKKKQKGKKDKSDKPKKAMTPFILFSQAKRNTVREENPDAPFGEIARILGAKWKALNESEKAIWVAAAAAAAATNGGSEGGKSKRRKKENGEKEGDEEECDSDSDEEGSDEEEEGSDEEEENDDKDLFPDSDDEA